MKSLLIHVAMVGAALAQAPVHVDVSTLRPGDVIPDVRGVTLDGKPFNLREDMKGRIVLLDFWATWCGPCLAETPNILKNHERWHEKGFEVVGICLDDKAAAAAAYCKGKNLPWVQLCDGMAFRSPLVRSFGVTSIPQLVLLGRDGRVLSGDSRGAKLGEELERAMASAGVAAPSGNQTDLSALDALLTRGPDDAATRAVEDLLSGSSVPTREIDSLIGRHACGLSGMNSPWALYLLADSVLSRESVPMEVWIHATAMRARCALDLGGPYVAEQVLGAASEQDLRNSPAYQTLVIHRACKTGRGREAVQILHSMAMDGKVLYGEVRSTLELLSSTDAGDSANLLAELRFWLKAQEHLPADRMKAEARSGKLRVSYNPAGTNLTGCLLPKLMLAPEGATFFSVPMILEGDAYVAEIDAPQPGRPVRWYVTDGRSRSDTDEGRFWSAK